MSSSRFYAFLLGLTFISTTGRFLQSPHETIAEGAPRRFTDGAAAWHIKSHIISAKESQTSLSKS